MFVFLGGTLTAPEPLMARPRTATAQLARDLNLSFATSPDPQIAAVPAAESPSAEPEDQSAPETQPAPEPRATSLAALVDANSGVQARDAESVCLATAVYFESKGEPLAGQLAVAQVMINRTQSGRFPPTLCGVVKQSRQFSFVRNGQFPHIDEGSKAWRVAQSIGVIARDELWHPVVGRAMFFHAKRVSPRWNAVQVASVGNHIFYR